MNAKQILPVIFFFFSIAMGVAQNWAGPDTTTCPSIGVMIGSDSAPDDYCFYWSPATGLSSISAKRPTAQPKETTIYTLTAVGPNFSKRVVDEVTVFISTGGVVVAPSYTQPNGHANQAHAKLTTKPPNATIIWSIENDAHGCKINSSTGKIDSCNQVGDVTIRATIAGNEACYAEGKLRVNVGVKQVFAIDAAHPTRKATDGDTLHLIGHNAAKLKAIHNDGEDFGMDEPDWTGSTVTPPSPHADEWTSDAGTPTFLHIVAGEKNVYVSREQPNEVGIADGLGALGTLLTMLKELVKPSSEMSKGYSFDETQTSACQPLDMGIEPNISLKRSPVEKFNSPKKGYKDVIEGELAASLTAKVCFPPPYSSVPNPLFMYSVYVFGNGTAKLTAGLTKDESVADPATWKQDSLNFATELKLGVGGELGIFVPGDVIGIEGMVAGTVVIGLDPTFNFSQKKITTVVKVEPLVVEGNFKVWWLSPDNVMINLPGKYNVLDPFESQPFNTLDLSSY